MKLPHQYDEFEAMDAYRKGNRYAFKRMNPEALQRLDLALTSVHARLKWQLIFWITVVALAPIGGYALIEWLVSL